MSLSDFLRSGDFAVYTEIALVLFFATFLGIVVYTLLKPRKEMERMSRMPVEDDNESWAIAGDDDDDGDSSR